MMPKKVTEGLEALVKRNHEKAQNTVFIKKTCFTACFCCILLTVMSVSRTVVINNC